MVVQTRPPQTLGFILVVIIILEREKKEQTYIIMTGSHETSHSRSSYLPLFILIIREKAKDRYPLSPFIASIVISSRVSSNIQPCTHTHESRMMMRTLMVEGK